MAPLLRAGLHGFRFTVRARMELRLPKFAESNSVRWYGDTAILEDAAPPAIDASGENGASSTPSDPSKGSGDAGNLKEACTTASPKRENGPKESSTDKLTNLILARMRAKNSPGDSSPSPTTSAPSKAVKPAEKSSESSRADKWDQVMESMRNMAAKRREQVAKNAAAKTFPPKRQESEDQDDFSDLDHPSEQLEKELSGLPSPKDVFQAYRESLKQRESSSQFSNVKQKSSEFKAVSSSSFKALETESSIARPQGTGSVSDGIIGKTKDSGLQSPSKEPKRLSFEFLKPSDTKVELLNSVESKTTTSFGVQPKPNDAARPSLNQNDQKHDSGLLPGAAGARARELSLEDMIKNDLNSFSVGHPPGHMVSIHNVSAQSNLALIKEALSIHGEVITSFRKPNLDGSYSVFAEFKTAEAMEDALAAKWLQIDRKSFSITRANAPFTTVVRLSRVSANADSQVAAVCEKFGQIDHVRKRGGSVYDVYYKAGEQTNMSAILERLNEVTLNQRRWIAFPAPLLLPGPRREFLRTNDGETWHSQQMNQTLSKLEMGLEAMYVYFEDLKALVSMEDEFTK